MKRKLLSLLVLLMTAATGAWAEIITWDASNVFNESHAGDYVMKYHPSATFEGITISMSGTGGSIFQPYQSGTTILQVYGSKGDSFTFTAPVGKKFAKIGINTDGYVNSDGCEGWNPTSDTQLVWSGTPANTVTTGTGDMRAVRITSIVFYLADAAVTAKEGASGEYWSTYYNATQGFTADENTMVFQAALSGNQLTMTEVANREIPAGKAVILKSSSSTILLTAATTTATLEGNQLVGTATAITNPGNAYVLNKGTNGVGFYKLSSGGTIGANKAYLVSGAGAPEFFGFDGNTTGIDATLVNSEKVNSVVYDLQGRRVAQPTKGLYIVNGKKVVIK